MTWLGLGVANLVNLFNPRLVVIGGGVSLAGEQVVAPVRAQVHRYAMKVQRETVTITTSSLRDAAGVWRSGIGPPRPVNVYCPYG